MTMSHTKHACMHTQTHEQHSAMGMDVLYYDHLDGPKGKQVKNEKLGV